MGLLVVRLCRIAPEVDEYYAKIGLPLRVSDYAAEVKRDGGFGLGGGVGGVDWEGAEEHITSLLLGREWETAAEEGLALVRTLLREGEERNLDKLLRLTRLLWSVDANRLRDKARAGVAEHWGKNLIMIPYDHTTGGG
jgi:hypothetical protein